MRTSLSALGLTAVLAIAAGAPAAMASEQGPAPLAAASSPSSMSWSAVTTKGGGWVTGMVTAPTGEIYTRTDVGGAYRWDEAAQSWEQMLTSAGVPEIGRAHV